MKKLSVLLSVLLMICMLGTVAYAATTDATITLVPDNTSVTVENTVTITVGLAGDTNDYGINGTAKIAPKWDTNYFEFVSAEVDSTSFGLTNATNLATGNSANGYVVFSQKVVADDGVVSGDQVFGTVTLKAIKAGNSDITLHASSTAVKILAGTTVADRADVAENTTVAIAITEAGGSEEIFDVDVEAGYTKDAIAIFAKNVTDEAFAAGTYGVIFGGNKYAAGINPDTACEAGKTFVVKFVGGADKLASGSYKYQAYYNNGVDVTPEKVLNIQ